MDLFNAFIGFHTHLTEVHIQEIPEAQEARYAENTE